MTFRHTSCIGSYWWKCLPTLRWHPSRMVGCCVPFCHSVSPPGKEPLSYRVEGLVLWRPRAWGLLEACDLSHGLLKFSVKEDKLNQHWKACTWAQERLTADKQGKSRLFAEGKSQETVGSTSPRTQQPDVERRGTGRQETTMATSD